ncbi:hypothetical protein ABKN59_008017 [Abortiporus biennis]
MIERCLPIRQNEEQVNDGIGCARVHYQKQTRGPRLRYRSNWPNSDTLATISDIPTSCSTLGKSCLY